MSGPGKRALDKWRVRFRTCSIKVGCYSARHFLTPSTFDSVPVTP